MAVAALVAFWVLVGLGVFLVALRGGRGERREQPSGRASRSPSRGLLLATIAGVVVLGVVVPGVVVATHDEDQTRRARGGVDLSASAANGRELFAESCAQCHALRASNSVGQVGPNLDDLRPPRELVLDAIEQGRARGQGQMPARLLVGEEAEDVADFVTAVAGR